MAGRVTTGTDRTETPGRSTENIGGCHGCPQSPRTGLLDGMTTAPSTYALRLSDDELGRYRMMAARARAEEGDLWTAAGIVAGRAGGRRGLRARARCS